MLLFQFAIPGLLQAQISGIVKETATEKLVEGAQVFISNTSISTVTNDKGEFLLEGIAPGFVDFILYKEGYQIFKSPIRIQEGKKSRLNLKLTPAVPTVLPAGDRDQDRPRNLSQFESYFLGTSPGAAKCKITNPQGLVFLPGSPLKVSLKEPLICENSALGYRNTFYLLHAEAELPQTLSLGVVRFDTMVAKSVAQQSEWKLSREDRFFGSQRHFFWSLANGMTQEQGFELFNEKKELLITDSLVHASKLAG